jgi:hypothetical protein
LTTCQNHHILKTIQRRRKSPKGGAEDGNGEPARFKERNIEGTNHELKQNGNKDITFREQNCNKKGTVKQIVNKPRTCQMFWFCSPRFIEIFEIILNKIETLACQKSPVRARKNGTL